MNRSRFGPSSSTLCAWCIAPLPKRPRSTSGPIPQARFCSQTCRVRLSEYRNGYGKPPWLGVKQCCLVCGAKARRSCCSSKCSAEKLRRVSEATKRQHLWLMAVKGRCSCPECGDEFMPQSLVHKFCSRQCSRRASWRDHQHRRRIVIHSEDSERFTTRQIAERDKWRCHLCNGKVTQEDWSIDHLLPISAGGRHRLDNVALAHFKCNTLRGVGGTAQLRLIG